MDGTLGPQAVVETRPAMGRRGGAGGADAPAVPGLVTSLEQVRRGRREIFQHGLEARLRRMKTGVRLSARLIEEVTLTSPRGRRAAMVTLTYACGREWASRHVSGFLEALAKWAARRGFGVPYCWVAELQQRGAVHYHVVLWLPRGETIPKPDKRGWWPHGSTRVEWARRAVSYMTKYASKGDASAVFPSGLRLWGAGGLSAEARELRGWLRLPGWLRELVGERQRVVRAPGGLWVASATGEVWRSPYEFVRLERLDGRVIGAWFRLREV